MTNTNKPFIVKDILDGFTVFRESDMKRMWWFKSQGQADFLCERLNDAWNARTPEPEVMELVGHCQAITEHLIRLSSGESTPMSEPWEWSSTLKDILSRLPERYKK